jgi:hypothetical protein
MLMTIDVDDEGGAAAGFYTIATMMIFQPMDC